MTTLRRIVAEGPDDRRQQHLRIRHRNQRLLRLGLIGRTVGQNLRDAGTKRRGRAVTHRHQRIERGA